MKKAYSFEKCRWTEGDLFYAYSAACMDKVCFRQENDCIVNGKGNSFCGYEMITLLDKEKRGVGVRLTAECSFENFGAPLIVITDDLSTNGQGERVYGVYYEVVAYENGINIWAVKPAEQGANCPIDGKLLATKKFPIAGNTRIRIVVEIYGERIKAWVNGEYLETEVKGLPKAFWTGITACEGVNRFYTFTIEDTQDKESI